MAKAEAASDWSAAKDEHKPHTNVFSPGSPGGLKERRRAAVKDLPSVEEDYRFQVASHHARRFWSDSY